MTEAELLNAAHTYLLVKQAVIEFAPQDPRDTGATESNRGKLLNFSNGLMAESRFERNLERSLESLWNRIKLHPLLANVQARIATCRANAIEKHKLVGDFECFRGAVDNPRHEWYVKKGHSPQYTAEGREAIAFTRCQEGYAVMPYRTKAEIVYRWAHLATLFHEARDAGDTNARQFFARLGGGDVEKMRDPTSDELWHLREAFCRAHAFGPVTALHALMDCGFPVVKPDVWLSKGAQELGWLQDLNANAFKAGDHGACSVVFRRLADIADRASRIDGRVHTLRELDWWIAKFGMNPQPDVGFVTVPSRKVSINTLRDQACRPDGRNIP